MAREIKKPTKIIENELKEYAGDVVIDVTHVAPKAKLEEAAPPSVVAEAIAVQAAQAASDSNARFISFNAWFQKVSAKNPRIKLSYREAIEAHCKAVGLDVQATEEAYDAALKHFGL
jgi:hypothetical protein